jgi:hypothetical protein
MKDKIPESVRKILSKWGQRGGRAGSREDKQKAGRLGHKAMIDKLVAKETAKEPTQ